jgi:hypothetical protein
MFGNPPKDRVGELFKVLHGSREYLIGVALNLQALEHDYDRYLEEHPELPRRKYQLETVIRGNTLEIYVSESGNRKISSLD